MRRRELRCVVWHVLRFTRVLSYVLQYYSSSATVNPSVYILDFKFRKAAACSNTTLSVQKCKTALVRQHNSSRDYLIFSAGDLLLEGRDLEENGGDVIRSCPRLAVSASWIRTGQLAELNGGRTLGVPKVFVRQVQGAA